MRRIPIAGLVGLTLAIGISFAVSADPGGEIDPELAKVSQQRISGLLPRIMAEKDIDLWLTFTREGATDPLLAQLGSDHMVARAALIFARTAGGGGGQPPPPRPPPPPPTRR